MKRTDFAQCLEAYLRKYLPGQAGLSENTVMAYRDTFILLVEFLENARKQNPDKLTLADFNLVLSKNSLTGWKQKGITAHQHATRGWLPYALLPNTHVHGILNICLNFRKLPASSQKSTQNRNLGT